MIQFLKKPSQLVVHLDRWIPWGMLFSGILWMIGLWFALVGSPPDGVQGETVRIMYIHVPCSWGALMTYLGMALVSAYGFIKQNPMAHLLTKAMAPIGTLLCFMSLLTGAIWGKPTWGTWWVWDARLTSMLVLFFLYVGYLVIVYHLKPETQALKSAAMVAVIGSLNLPIIKWSVTWWSTLHQPASLMRMAKPAIHIDLLIPLIIMTLAFFSLCLTLFFINLRLLVNQQRLRALNIRQNEGIYRGA